MLSILALIVTLVATVPTYEASLVKLWSRNVSAVEDLGEDRLGGRLNNVDAGWELWQERPAFGWGIGGNFESVRTDGMGSSYSTGQIVGNATNQLVQAAAEGGVFGFTAFIGFLAAVAMMGWKQISGRGRRCRAAQGVALFCLASVVGIQTVVYVRDLSLVGYVLCVAIGCLVLNELPTANWNTGQRASPRMRSRTYSDASPTR
jgi:O-antigen ligase